MRRGPPVHDPAFQAALVALRMHPQRRRLADDLEAFVGAIPYRDEQPAVHRARLMDLLGVERSRIAFLAKTVRHEIPEIGDGLVSGPSGYRFTLDEAHIGRYARQRRRYQLSDATSTDRVEERLRRHVEPSLPTGPAGDAFRRAIAHSRRDSRRVIDDLEVLI